MSVSDSYDIHEKDKTRHIGVLKAWWVAAFKSTPGKKLNISKAISALGARGTLAETNIGRIASDLGYMSRNGGVYIINWDVKDIVPREVLNLKIPPTGYEIRESLRVSEKAVYSKPDSVQYDDEICSESSDGDIMKRLRAMEEKI